MIDKHEKINKQNKFEDSQDMESINFVNCLSSESESALDGTLPKKSFEEMITSQSFVSIYFLFKHKSLINMLTILQENYSSIFGKSSNTY